MQVSLDEQERTLLCALLEEHVTTLSHEIHKTDTRVFKDQLKQEEVVSKALLGRLKGAG